MDNFDIWFSKNPNQRVLWTSTVELSEKYFNTLIDPAVPLDSRAIAALSHSAMALDIYAWLAQRLHRVPVNQPYTVTWVNLHEQLGQGYKQIRQFRSIFLKALREVVSQILRPSWKTPLAVDPQKLSAAGQREAHSDRRSLVHG